MNLLSAVFDIIVVVTVILITATSMKRGIIASVIEFVGIIISMIASIFLSSILANFIYIQFMQNNIIDSVSKVVSSGGSSSSVFAALPICAQNELISQGINENNILAISNGSEATYAIESLVRPIMTSFITRISITIIFTVLSVIVITVATKLSKKAHLSELAAPEKLVSCIFGILKSLMFLMVIAILIEIISMLLSQSSIITFNHAIDKSLLYKLLNKINIPSLIINLMTGM